MEKLQAAVTAFDYAPTPTAQRSKAAALADAARRLLAAHTAGHAPTRPTQENDDDDALDFLIREVDDTADDHSAVRLGLTVHETRPFDFGGVIYDTAMNAFQAQKAALADRHRFAKVSWVDAVQMGRGCKIDVEEWNDNRQDLMLAILREQAQQHRTLKAKVRQCGDAYTEDSMKDDYWHTHLPLIWATLKEEFDEEEDLKRGVAQEVTAAVATAAKRRRLTAEERVAIVENIHGKGVLDTDPSEMDSAERSAKSAEAKADAA